MGGGGWGTQATTGLEDQGTEGLGARGGGWETRGLGDWETKELEGQGTRALGARGQGPMGLGAEGPGLGARGQGDWRPGDSGLRGWGNRGPGAGIKSAWDLSMDTKWGDCSHHVHPGHRATLPWGRLRRWCRSTVSPWERRAEAEGFMVGVLRQPGPCHTPACCETGHETRWQRWYRHLTGPQPPARSSTQHCGQAHMGRLGPAAGQPGHSGW